MPSDFDGIPILNNQRSWFISYRSERKPDDVQRLWRVFRLALGKDPLDDPAFRRAFDDALEVKYTNLNLTIGLFWIRPDTFVNLDQTGRQFLKLKLPSDGLSGEFYISTVRNILAKGQPLPKSSYQAWRQVTNGEPPVIDATKDNDVWMVGAYWSDNDPPDLTRSGSWTRASGRTGTRTATWTRFDPCAWETGLRSRQRRHSGSIYHSMRGIERYPA